MSDKDKVQLFNLLMDIGDDKIVEQPDSIMGDTLSLIYGEWMNMESRNGYKKEFSHLGGASESIVSSCPGDPEHRVEYSRVEENIIEDNKTEDNSDDEITQIIEYWNNELGNKYEVTDDLKEIYKKVRKKNDMQIVENTTVFYIDKCKKMEKQYHLSPYKFFKQSNGFITYKNSIC